MRAVTITAKSTDQDFEIRIRDGGPGIPECIRDTLFDPFVSYGKPNGTGLGLADCQQNRTRPFWLCVHRADL